MTIAVKNHAKLDISLLRPCLLLLYFFSFCQIFCLGLSEETNFCRNLVQSSSYFNFWVFSATSKHFSNHDVNIQPVSSFKSSKLNVFVEGLFCILVLGQNLSLGNFHLCQLVVFWVKLHSWAKIGTLSSNLDHHWNSREQKKILRRSSPQYFGTF